MRAAAPGVKRLLLAGGGHAHLFVLEALARRPLAGVHTVLLTPARLAPYSGMLPGVIAGHYAYEAACVDLAPLCRAAGCELRLGRLHALDAAARRVRCEDGSVLDYDLLSLDTGSAPDVAGVPGAAQHAVPVKPIEAFLERWRGFLAARSGRAVRLAVVGAGAAGVEVLLAMRLRALAAACRPQCLLLAAGEVALEGYAAGARRRVQRQLDAQGVRLLRRTPARAVEHGAVIGADGQRLEADFIVWATGAAAPAWPRAAGLACDASGFVRVDAQLRSRSHPAIFAAGDLASVDGAPRPRSGVFAVRAGPPLAANLRAALEGGELLTWRPQRRALALIGTGERHAVAAWGPFAFEGGWVWRWKQHIDRRFVARFGAGDARPAR